MNEELDYAEMLEIPVSTVNVVKKKSILRKKGKRPAEQSDDLKAKLLESVNERVGASVYSEDLTEIPKPSKRNAVAVKQNAKESKFVFAEGVLVALIAIGIFVTNLLLPNTVINTFLNSFSPVSAEEPAYTQFKLTSVVSDFSDAEVGLTDSGVIHFTAKGSVYPVCEGKVKSITQNNGLYTVEIAHTSTFISVVTGLTNVYSAEGSAVKSNVPLGYSDGENEVRVSMFDNQNLLNCYTLSGVVPVWKS